MNGKVLLTLVVVVLFGVTTVLAWNPYYQRKEPKLIKASIQISKGWLKLNDTMFLTAKDMEKVLLDSLKKVGLEIGSKKDKTDIAISISGIDISTGRGSVSNRQVETTCRAHINLLVSSSDNIKEASALFTVNVGSYVNHNYSHEEIDDDIGSIGIENFEEVALQALACRVSTWTRNLISEK